ncbi:hypothetical protein EZV62_021074 [Acer yangbiense]|uniref:Uncharacterized protein n=1 Tax=Acer yangbiense TaxID=1000413 RepID=A0A5C7H5Q0_9ROSI|nr:hypothetical protein EZV62_021074 [Acer yangbiense]
MAEKGRLQPLLTQILEGPTETKLSLASFLGELALNNDVKVIVAKTVGSSLINILKSGNIQAREAALKALNQISSCEASLKVLIAAGILPPLVKDLFTVGSNQLPMQLKEVSATILASIVSSGYDFDSIAVGPDHQTLVLVGLINSPTTVLNVVSAIKSYGTTISLVQFVKAPQKDLRVASIKLLQNLSSHMGQELADELRAAVGLLADLPERDVGLTRQMLDHGAFQLIFSRVVSIQKGETRGSCFVTPFLEGLVAVLARVTFVLAEEPSAITLCREYNLAAQFIELLQSNGLDKVQMVSATALENLSLESKNLIKLPELLPPGQAVEKLVALLDHTNEKVVEAALAALSTFLDDGVDVEQGVMVLCEAQGVKPILDVLLEKRTENLRRSVWTVERILRTDDIAYEVYGDPNVSTGVLHLWIPSSMLIIGNVRLIRYQTSLESFQIWDELLPNASKILQVLLLPMYVILALCKAVLALLGIVCKLSNCK